MNVFHTYALFFFVRQFMDSNRLLRSWSKKSDPWFRVPSASHLYFVAHKAQAQTPKAQPVRGKLLQSSSVLNADKSRGVHATTLTTTSCSVEDVVLIPSY